METIVIYIGRGVDNGTGIAKRLNDMLGNSLEKYGHPGYIANRFLSISTSIIDVFVVVEVYPMSERELAL